MICNTPQDFLLDPAKAGKQLTLGCSCFCGKKVFEHKTLAQLSPASPTAAKTCVACGNAQSVQCPTCLGTKVLCERCDRVREKHSDNGIASKNYYFCDVRDVKAAYAQKRGELLPMYKEGSCHMCASTGFVKCPICN